MLKTFKRYSELYWLFLIQRFKILMEYRVNFFIGMSSTVFIQAAQLTAVWVVMRQVPNLNGWTLDQILLIYGLLTLAKSLNHMFADNLWTLGWNYIRPGGFDRFLVRPIDPLFHLLADRFCHDGIGNFLVGVVLVARSFHTLGIPITFLNLLYLVIVVLAGGAIFVAINLITCVSAFWIIESVPVTLAFFQTNDFAKYPLTIYSRAIGIIMTWAIPYGLAVFYPAQYLMGINVGWMAFACVPVAGLMLFLGYRFWLFGLRHYGGTGT